MSLKAEIFDHFETMQMVYLATSKNDRPYVRPMILIYQADQFWLATGTEDKKVTQIRSNNKIEFCYPIKAESKSGYIRGYGQAIIEESDENRKMIFEMAQFIQNYWDDHRHPGFTLLKLDLEKIEYMRPGKSTTETLKVK